MRLLSNRFGRDLGQIIYVPHPREFARLENDASGGGMTVQETPAWLVPDMVVFLGGRTVSGSSVCYGGGF